METKNICKYSVNPSVEYARRSTDHESSFKLLSSIFYLPTPATVVVSPAYSLQSTPSIRSVGIVTFLLLFSFLQPWRLVASTPGAEDFFKYVTEEGESLFSEIIGEDGSINHEFSLNSAQTAVQTGIHSVSPSVECAPTNHESSSNCAYSSKPQLPSSAAAAVPPAFNLQPLASIQPIGRIVTTGGLKSTGNSSDEEESDQEDVEPKLPRKPKHNVS